MNSDRSIAQGKADESAATVPDRSYTAFEEGQSLLTDLGDVSAVRFAPSLQRVRVEGKYFACRDARVRISGVTYGPFMRGNDGEPFPQQQQVRADFERMRYIGINAIRTYCVPPQRLFEQAEEQGIGILMDVPWGKHVCFLENRRRRAEARKRVRDAARAGGSTGAVIAYSVGNEIPADIVRWHGARRVERFLASLYDTAKQADPHGLVTYANFPLTEYLDLSFLDFATFNVYLHDRFVFRNYLFRLQNLVGDRPLVLGELGMDTIRHGEAAQAELLGGHLREAAMAGLAGTFIFAWTDEWHTGGHLIEDWAFGITRADRAPKAAYHRLRVITNRPPRAWLGSAPRVSVVVCTYNGGRTLDQCLASLEALNYPDYEVIVVDDGSTDETSSVATRYPTVRVIHQENLGLSAARNVGFQSSTGDVIAYMDSDCFADPDWLTLLVSQLERTGAAGVGGPNLTPPGDWLAASVAASPGQPVHVLVDDQTAEHIPGCNMAFRRQALAAVNGFDVQFRKAGDDVDLCWRLQHDGHWITFAPGAVVWHHRRSTPGRYLRQQAGYGEAEALLQVKHSDKFTGWGSGKWRGVVYGGRGPAFRLSAPIIYRGTFATGLFQCLYQPAPAHWAMLPATLEWHGVALLLTAGAFVVAPKLAGLAGAMLTVSFAVALLQGMQAGLTAEHRHWRARFLVTALCYLQPLVRSGARYRARFMGNEFSRPCPAVAFPQSPSPFLAAQSMAYWSETGPGRIELLTKVLDYMNKLRIGKVIDSGWSDWDLGICCEPGIVLRVVTVDEDHGAGRRLVRVRYRLWVSPWLGWSAVAGLIVILTTARMPWTWLGIVALIGLVGRLWWKAGRTASRIVGLFDMMAGELQMVRCTGTLS